MKHSRTAEEIGALNIEMAARHGKPFNAVGGISGDHILHIPATREVPGPEEPDVSKINGRAPLAWEQDEIRAARLQARNAEGVLLAGTLGQP